MRLAKTRVTDSTFDINLAPFLDIIVSVVPLLLLSVVFVEVKMIDTPVPQVVQQAIEKDSKDPDPEVTLNLRAANNHAYTIEVTPKGAKTNLIQIPAIDGKFDNSALRNKTIELKTRYPQVFKMGLAPEADIPYNDLVQTMDAVRRAPASEKKFSVIDKKTGQAAETDLMFPNVSFSNVVGE